MTILATAPVRVDFAGGWSDVWDFAEERGGAVVNAAIALHTRVRCTTGTGRYHLRSEDTNEEVTAASPDALRYDGTLDVHKAALHLLPVPGGVDVVSRTEVPTGSGLGTSGSLDVALLTALTVCRGEPPEPAELAEMGFVLETRELALRGGRQDQYAAALGGFQYVLVGKGAGVTVRSVSLSHEAAGDLERHLALAYTGQSHVSSDTHRQVWRAFHAGNPDVVDAITTIRDLAAPAAQALERGEWRELARLMDANWTQQQRLHATMTTPIMRRMEAAVRQADAWAVKAMGAGAGGCLLVAHAPNDRARITAALQGAGGRLLDCRFTFDGVRAARDDAGHLQG